MPSNDAKIYKALKDHLDAQGYPYTVLEPLETFDPDPSQLYVFLDDLRYDNQRAYIGNGRHKARGSLMANVMAPLSWTYIQSVEAAGVFAGYFTHGTTFEYSDIKLWTAKDAQVVNAGYVDGSHYRMTVSCPWEGLV